MKEMKSIVTERFILRLVAPEDAISIFKILSDKETVKYLNMPKIEAIEDVEGIIEDYLKQYADGNKYPFAIIDKCTHELIGVFLIKLDLFDDDCFEFTVYIRKDYWNKGVYSEVLPHMTEFALVEIGTGNFRGFVMQSNKASAKVLLNNGFLLEKTFCVDGLPEMIESYLMTKEQFLANARNE